MKRLCRLAINEEGFIFDPSTGESFTINETGRYIIERLKKNLTSQDICHDLTDEFNIKYSEASRDVADFIDHLQTLKLL